MTRVNLNMRSLISAQIQFRMKKKRKLFPCLEKIEYLQLQIASRNLGDGKMKETFLPHISKDVHFFKKRKFNEYDNKEFLHDVLQKQSRNDFVISISRLRKSYNRLLDGIPHLGNGELPQIKSLSWLKSTIDDIYDYCSTRLCVEDISHIFNSKNLRNRSGNLISPKLQKIKNKKSLPLLCRQFLHNNIGIKTLMKTLLYNLLASIEFYVHDNPLIELFSSFLKEILDFECFIFFLLLRHTISKLPCTEVKEKRCIKNNQRQYSNQGNSLKFTAPQCIELLLCMGCSHSEVDYLLSNHGPLHMTVSELQENQTWTRSTFILDLLNLYKSNLKSPLYAETGPVDTMTILDQIQSSLDYNRAKRDMAIQLQNHILCLKKLRADLTSMELYNQKNATYFIKSKEYKMHHKKVESFKYGIQQLELNENNIWDQILLQQYTCCSEDDTLSQMRTTVHNIIQRFRFIVSDSYKKRIYYSTPRKTPRSLEIEKLSAMHKAAACIQRFFRRICESEEIKATVQYIVSGRIERKKRILWRMSKRQKREALDKERKRKK